MINKGKRIQPPPSPLGMYPLMISDEIMRIWLTPKEYERLRQAWRVGPGMNMILDAIERNVRENDEETRKRKLGQMWVAGRSCSKARTKEDAEVCERLMAEYKAENGAC